MFIKKYQRKDSTGKWQDYDRTEIYNNPFTLGRIKVDRPKAKKDGDNYRVYTSKSRDGLNCFPKKVITYNKDRPNERIVYLKFRRK